MCQYTIIKFKLLINIARRLSESKEIELPDEELTKIVGGNANLVDKYIWNFCELGALHQEAYDDGGGRGFHYISSGKLLHKVMEDIASELIAMYNSAVSEKISADERLNALIGFNEQSVQQYLKKAHDDIGSLKEVIRQQPMLATLEPTLLELDLRIMSLKTVCNVYDDVYKSLIIPVRQEGRSGLKSTRNWSIAGILLSSIIGLAVTIYFQLHPLSPVTSANDSVQKLPSDTFLQSRQHMTSSPGNK